MPPTAILGGDCVERVFTYLISQHVLGLRDNFAGGEESSAYAQTSLGADTHALGIDKALVQSNVFLIHAKL